MTDEHGPRGPHDDSHDDPTAARLRAALSAEAAMVQPDDHLSSIRERTAEGDRAWWRHPAALAVAAAVVLGVAVGGAAAVLGGGDDPTVAVGGKGTASAPPSAAATPSATPSTAEATATPSPAVAEVWVYYVMDSGAAGPRLYREQHVVEPGPGCCESVPAVLALEELTRQDAADPDYTSPWRGVRLLDYRVDGDVAVVSVDSLPDGAAAQDVAVQQLVHTVTANDADAKRVQLTVDGRLPSTGGLDEPVGRAPRVDVQGLIWLLSPAEGATVTSPVKIAGHGTAFEGTINWEVRRDGSEDVVAEGFTQGGSMGEFADFSDSVVLEPGTYQLRALEFSAEDGRPLNVDTKTFTVE